MEGLNILWGTDCTWTVAPSRQHCVLWDC